MRISQRLVANKLRNLTDGNHADGGGLYYRVMGASRSWVFRARVNGTVIQRGLGSASDVTLADAREQATKLRRDIALGQMPVAPRKMNAAADTQPRKKVRTFDQALREYLAANRSEWRNAKHGQQWENSLTQHAGVLFKLPVDKIDTQTVKDLLLPIWSEIPETARRVRMRIEAVLGAEIALGNRQGPNPAALRDNLQRLLPKHKTKIKAHHAVVEPDQVRPVFQAIWARRANTSSAALSLLVLCAMRSNEVRGLRWADVDLDRRLITIPAERMKAGRLHFIPLSEQAVALLKELPRNGELVFPNRDGKPLSDTSVSKALKFVYSGEGTVHGWRALFRSIMEERGHATNVLEYALAHVAGDKTVQAYARSTLVDQRVAVMHDWADYLVGKPNCK